MRMQKKIEREMTPLERIQAKAGSNIGKTGASFDLNYMNEVDENLKKKRFKQFKVLGKKNRLNRLYGDSSVIRGMVYKSTTNPSVNPAFKPQMPERDNLSDTELANYSTETEDEQELLVNKLKSVSKIQRGTKGEGKNFKNERISMPASPPQPWDPSLAISPAGASEASEANAPEIRIGPGVKPMCSPPA